MPRWTAVIIYRSQAGIVDVVHDIDEICDLDNLVERGPDWDTIESITIRRTGGDRLTLEEASSR
ncbi:hypothetical protein RHODGE_RHODGE_02852 [Rhodoplanes serenus]|uniref:Uncharacterized protein n=1 Tax=Rhodoplanes serenus TaxID=200615 RepID=A0A447CWM7_9BRAD|nr:hypothetical protein [Rhodoplanes serenus]MBI5112722.1 hypothetical protein [Rhodovulum sp.]VCU09683.1 hypothetical protein RHODGE_RHODGE_02852 [Rhodoplanes serenus]